MKSRDEALAVLLELQQIEKDYSLIKDSESIEQLKILVIENSLLKFANYNLSESIADDDDDY